MYVLFGPKTKECKEKIFFMFLLGNLFQYDNEGVAVVLVHDQKKNFYKKFLYEPFPVESSLLDVLPDHLNAEVVAGM